MCISLARMSVCRRVAKHPGEKGALGQTDCFVSKRGTLPITTPDKWGRPSCACTVGRGCGRLQDAKVQRPRIPERRHFHDSGNGVLGFRRLTTFAHSFSDDLLYCTVCGYNLVRYIR